MPLPGGGCYSVDWNDNVSGYWSESNQTVQLGAWVPVGLDQYILWDEAARDGLFSGTVCFTCGDIGSNTGLMHTHAYWAKDDADHVGGADAIDVAKLQSLPVEFQSRYEVRADGQGGYSVIQIPIQNKYDLAFHLAVMHTLQEIERLWQEIEKKGEIAPGITLAKAFGFDAAELKENGIKYQLFVSKSSAPESPAPEKPEENP